AERLSRQRGTSLMRSVSATLVFALTLTLALSGAALGQAINWPNDRAPRPLPARESSFPPYQITTLPNGLQVVAVSHHEQPAVSLRLLIRAGGSQDPASKPGVAY